MARRGATPDEIREAVGGVRPGQIFVEDVVHGIAAPVSVPLAHAYGYYTGLGNSDDSARLAAKKRTKGRWDD